METQLTATRTERETSRSLRIDSRLNGPRRSANGGFAAGTIASWIEADAVTVVLHRPIPLSAELDVRSDLNGGVVVLHNISALAYARPGLLTTDARPTAPSLVDAFRASVAHPLRGVRHTFAHCVVCGPARHDGMHVTPGPVPDRPHLLAAPWVVQANVASSDLARVPAVWAALDCPSYPADAMDRGILCLLGTMTARVDRRPSVGESLVVYSWTREQHGRRYETSSVMVDADGEVVARADSTWIAIRHQRLQKLIGRFSRAARTHTRRERS